MLVCGRLWGAPGRLTQRGLWEGRGSEEACCLLDVPEGW